MVLGIGIDVMEIPRIERFLSKATDGFLNRFFTKKEIAYCNTSKQKSKKFAAIFAGKESILKALGLGWQVGVKFTDMEILYDVNRKPMALVSGKIKEMADQLNVQEIFITISHYGSNAIAQVLLEGQKMHLSMS